MPAQVRPLYLPNKGLIPDYRIDGVTEAGSSSLRRTVYSPAR